MASKSGRPSTDLISELQRNPGGFNFFQAVRILQADCGRTGSAVGGNLTPQAEGIRFKTQPSLAYPGSSVRKLTRATDSRAHELEVNFMSLVGVSGPLPLHYTEQLLARLQLRDHSLADFLDLFHHRSIGLFFRAWKKYTFPFNTKVGETPRQGGAVHMLRSLVGLGTGKVSLGADLPLDTWLSYAGHFARPTRTGDGLERMVADVVGHPVRLESFVGTWLELAHSSRSRLLPEHTRGGRIEVSQRLGQGFVLGSRVWDVQSKVRLHIGPLTQAQYRKWMPSSPACERLGRLIQSYLGHQVDFEFVIQLAQGKLHCARLYDPSEDKPAAAGTKGILNGAESGGLGRDTWLGDSRSRPLPVSARVTIDSPRLCVR